MARTAALPKKVTSLKPGARRPHTLLGVDSETLHAMIAEAAYYKAEARGFEPGAELAAEKEICSRGG